MYLALYRKWRPKTFDDVISQPHITTTLKHEIQTGQIAHAYLFTGSRGTGKTTCAKIFAKAVNCLNPHDGEPCGVCAICKGLEDGSILDVTEMDGASNNSVADVRQLRDEAGFTPVSCKYRVYIIDEVHMLSASAFNALLKIMEEPPPHVIFILATTEVHKIPATIISRCQRFDFHRIQTEDMAQRMLSIAEQEPFSLQPEAAAQLARLADGAMRDALSLLDQCAASADRITVETVDQTIGVAGEEVLARLHAALRKSDAAEALQIVGELYNNAKDLSRLCDELIAFYRGVMICISVPAADALLSASPAMAKLIRRAAEEIPLARVLQIIDGLQSCAERFGFIANKRLEMEVCLVRLCAPPASDSGALVRRLDQLEEAVKKGAGQANGRPASPPRPAAQQPSADPPKRSLLKDARPLSEWKNILEDLQQRDETGMLAGFLTGSKALAVEDMLLIEAQNPVVGDKIADKKQLLIDIARERTGKTYRVFVRKTPPAPSESGPLDEMEKKAERAGIPVETE